MALSARRAQIVMSAPVTSVECTEEDDLPAQIGELAAMCTGLDFSVAARTTGKALVANGSLDERHELLDETALVSWPIAPSDAVCVCETCMAIISGQHIHGCNGCGARFCSRTTRVRVPFPPVSGTKLLCRLCRCLRRRVLPRRSVQRCAPDSAPMAAHKCGRVQIRR